MKAINTSQFAVIPIPVNPAPSSKDKSTLPVQLYASVVNLINNLIEVEAQYPNLLDGHHEYKFPNTQSIVRFPNGIPYFDNIIGQILSTPWFFTNTKRENLRERIMKMKDEVGCNEALVECNLHLNNHSLSRLMSVHREMNARKFGISVSNIINYVALKYSKNIEKLFKEKSNYFRLKEDKNYEPISPVFIATPEFSDEVKSAQKTLIIHTDGASKNNGFDEDAAVSWTIRDSENNILEAGAKTIGKATNNQAEYHALSAALDVAKKYCFPEKTKLEIYSDSELMVCQLTGVYGVRSYNIYGIYNHVYDKAEKFKECEIRHLPRDNANIRYCDALCNMTLHDMFINELYEFD